jgi:hypothetical protein
MSDDTASPHQPPGPDPALKRLDPFMGTWDMRGRTLDSDVDNVVGRAASSFSSASRSPSWATRSRASR